MRGLLDLGSVIRSAPESVGGPKWLRALLFIAPALVALGVAIRHGPYLIDDAYITFRYAENLAAGHGVVFNRGEAVLGTSTPLMTFVLGLFKLLGVSVPLAARWLGILSAAGVVLLVESLALPSMGPFGAAAVGICLALHPDLAFTANSGMETGLSMAAVYGGLLLTLRGRFGLAGLVGGAAFLLRPDGLLVISIAFCMAALRSPRGAWRVALAAVLVSLPWLITATLNYGSIVPHSVMAKQAIHPASPLGVLGESLLRLSVGTEMRIACVLALAGVFFAARRRSGLLLVALWMAMYQAGLMAARVQSYFPWYLSPLYPGILLLAAYGVHNLAGLACPPRSARVGLCRAAALSLAPVVLLALGGLGLYGTRSWNEGTYQSVFGDRVQTYRATADALRSRCAPGDVVFVGEVGALAYGLPEQVILDSSGINSPAVLRARIADRDRLRAAGVADPLGEGSPAWVRDVIGRFRPRYIVTWGPWLHIATIMRDPSIMRSYHHLTELEHSNFYVLERTAQQGVGRPD